MTYWTIHFQYLLILYFNFAVIYDVVTWSLELAGKMQPWEANYHLTDYPLSHINDLLKALFSLVYYFATGL